MLESKGPLASLARRRGPFRFHFRIGLALAARLGTGAKPFGSNPAKRPNRGTTHQWRFIVEQSLGFHRKTGIAGIADCDEYVAHEARAADALDRALGKQSAECGVVEPGQIGELRGAQRLPRGEFYFVAGHRELVPRTDRQAIVAAIDAIAHQRPKFARDLALVFDGEVGDAAPRIEAVRCRKSRGGTNIEASAAGPAMIGFRRIGGQVERGEDRAEK